MLPRRGGVSGHQKGVRDGCVGPLPPINKQVLGFGTYLALTRADPELREFDP